MCVWKYLPSNKTGPCRGSPGGGLHARSPAPCPLVFPLCRGRGKGGGGVDVRGQGGLHFLLEEVEARAVFPLRTGCADAGYRDPVPPDSAVVGPFKSDSHSNIHVPAVM